MFYTPPFAATQNANPKKAKGIKLDTKPPIDTAIFLALTSHKALIIKAATQKQKPNTPAGDTIRNDVSTDIPSEVKIPTKRYIPGKSNQPKTLSNNGLLLSLEIFSIIL